VKTLTHSLSLSLLVAFLASLFAGLCESDLLKDLESFSYGLGLELLLQSFRH